MVEAVEALVPLELRTSSACVPSGSTSSVGLKLNVKVERAVCVPSPEPASREEMIGRAPFVRVATAA